jgi:hypothetical protein
MQALSESSSVPHHPWHPGHPSHPSHPSEPCEPPLAVLAIPARFRLGLGSPNRILSVPTPGSRPRRPGPMEGGGLSRVDSTRKNDSESDSEKRLKKAIRKSNPSRLDRRAPRGARPPGWLPPPAERRVCPPTPPAGPPPLIRLCACASVCVCECARVRVRARKHARARASACVCCYSARVPARAQQPAPPHLPRLPRTRRAGLAAGAPSSPPPRIVTREGGGTGETESDTP